MKKIINTALKHSGLQTKGESGEQDLPLHKKPANQDYKRWLHHHLPEMNPSEIITMYDVRTMI